MKKLSFILIVSACVLNGCHTKTTNTSDNSNTPTPADTARRQVHAATPPPADTTIKDGLLIKKYPNGVIKERSYYIAGRRQGECQSFYPSGKLESDDNFAAGLIDGATVTYYENGQKRYVGSCTKGKPTGKWVFYDEKGKQVNVKDYGIPGKSAI